MALIAIFGGLLIFNIFHQFSILHFACKDLRFACQATSPLKDVVPSRGSMNISNRTLGSKKINNYCTTDYDHRDLFDYGARTWRNHYPYHSNGTDHSNLHNCSASNYRRFCNHYGSGSRRTLQRTDER